MALSPVNTGVLAAPLVGPVAGFLAQLAQEPLLQAAYVIGPAARGEFDPSRMQVQVLLVADRYPQKLLDTIASLGRAWGRKGITAPLLLTPEYLTRATDAFPVELFDLVHNHLHMGGEDLLKAVRVDDRHLRVHSERELRLLRLNLRQAYVRAAGDSGFLADYLVETVPAVLSAMRVVTHLTGGDPAQGNTAVARFLADSRGLDVLDVLSLWELHKRGGRLSRDEAARVCASLDDLLATLVTLVDALDD